MQFNLYYANDVIAFYIYIGVVVGVLTTITYSIKNMQLRIEDPTLYEFNKWRTSPALWLAGVITWPWIVTNVIDNLLGGGDES